MISEYAGQSIIAICFSDCMTWYSQLYARIYLFFFFSFSFKFGNQFVYITGQCHTHLTEFIIDAFLSMYLSPFVLAQNADTAKLDCETLSEHQFTVTRPLGLTRTLTYLSVDIVSHTHIHFIHKTFVSIYFCNWRLTAALAAYLATLLASLGFITVPLSLPSSTIFVSCQALLCMSFVQLFAAVTLYLHVFARERKYFAALCSLLKCLAPDCSDTANKGDRESMQRPSPDCV